MDPFSLINLLASAAEIQTLVSGKRRKLNKKAKKERQTALEELEKEVESTRSALGLAEDVSMRAESRITPRNASSRRASALLWAHLLRLQPKDVELHRGEFVGDDCIQH